MSKVNRRKKLLINPGFQLSFLKNLMILNIAVCGIFYAAHSYFFWHGRELGRSIPLPSKHVYFLFLNEQQRTMNLISLVTMCLISGIILSFGLIFSHRIAGPVYRLKKFLREKASGKEKGVLAFRQKDYFPEVADAVNDYIDKTAKKDSKHKKAA